MANNDPLIAKQWFLSAIGIDKLNDEFSGKGVTSLVMDDGVEKTHEDLAGNYMDALEFKSGGVALAPNVGDSVHGTSVAGIMFGVANNGIGGQGISYGAKFAGVDIFGNAGSNMISAMKHMANADTANNSWGWTDSYADSLGTSFGKQFVDAIKYVADYGRGGLGTIVVNSAGNEWNDEFRGANASEFSASRHTITVGAIGQNGDVAYYSNRGANVLVSAPSNGGGAGIATTDMTGTKGSASGNYTETFGGTSAAAPIVTATTNLMLEASGKSLGWRDVQDILAITADHTTPTSIGGTVKGQMVYGWQINGARNVDGGGMLFSNDVGYGQVDAFEAVRFAEVWKNFGVAQTSANEKSATVSATFNKALADNGVTTAGLKVTQAVQMEHVDLTLTLNHANVKELKVELVSPDGTVSVLMNAMTGTAVGGTAWTWTYGSDALRGVLSTGDWTVRVTDTKTGNVGTLVSAKLDIYGDEVTSNDVYHYTDDFAKLLAVQSGRAVLTDANGGEDWLNLSAMTKNGTVDLSTSNGWFTVEGTKVAIAGAIEHAVTGDGNDVLLGNDLANRLLGMRGNDVLEGKGGADVLDGGAGIDTASYASSNAGVTVDLKAATQVGGHAQGDVLVSIENLVGSDYADRLTGDANSNVLTGGKGDDVLDGGAGTDTALFSGKLSDYVVARGTDAGGSWVSLSDKVTGRDGLDKLYGIEKVGFADGTVDASGLQVTSTTPTPPTTPVTPTPPTVPVVPGSTYAMSTKADVFLGGAGNDVFKFVTAGLGGSDKIDGGAGIDTLDLSGVSASTRVFVQLNSESFSVGSSYGIAKGIENLVGSDGGDTLYGNDLDNRIDGGKGNDYLRGFGGKDVFAVRGASGSDIVYDFVKGQDKLDFGVGMDRAHLNVRVSGNDLVVYDADSIVTLIGQKNMVLTDADLLFV